MRALGKIISPWLPGGILLGWRQLIREKKRFCTALAGVSFGVILMLFQLGIFQAFMLMAARPIDAMKGELAMVSRNFQYFMDAKSFPERRLYQTLALPDVKEVYPVMIDYGSWRHPETGREGDQAVFGVRPHANPFILPGILGREDILSLPDGALYDERSNPSYGDIAEIMNRDEVIHGEINGRRVRILGTFELGETLAVFGHIVVGVDAFRRLLQRTDNGIELGMIELRPGANALEAAGRLNALLPGDVEVITRQELILREKTYWEEHTPLGFIVISGMIIAMFVGAVIVYQILYTDINDHVREYATLKAMGLGDGFFLRLVLQEAAILTALGFIPGLLFTWVLFYLAETEGGLPTRLTIPDTLLVFGLTVVTCVIAGLLATRRLRAADPADIF